jgi:hypothetical protein
VAAVIEAPWAEFVRTYSKPALFLAAEFSQDSNIGLRPGIWTLLWCSCRFEILLAECVSIEPSDGADGFAA